ncbi:TIGR03773 family transporter-associated surface protein [Streptomyces sp. NBC_00038]|uniref:TIGR03773 family transporter-associated surface protein n=1 Tax=Streptomyces sp. NBC_00038 TaxID=2903615 RepID=UPI00224FC8F8|nr:TIGR03773 family transporter-associated surface protein [Streptomyces sp. NBC_00038]MCX5560264.1 TIGR03773 family transporter-associated surface protein [Streptomyces sp. NBC_00038]
MYGRVCTAVALAASLTVGGSVAFAADDSADAGVPVVEVDDSHRVVVSGGGEDFAGSRVWEVTADETGWGRDGWSLSGAEGPGAVTSEGQERDARWVFAAAGTYELVFRTGEATQARYQVFVGDAAIEEAETGAEPDAPPSVAVGAPSAEATGTPAVSMFAAQQVPQLAAEKAQSAADELRSTAEDDVTVVSTKATLDEGHIDIAARVVGGRMQIHVKDGTVAGKTTWREPSSLVLHVKPVAEKTIPESDDFTFLGEAGDPVWLLDQVQQDGLLWPGWSTENIPAGTAEGEVRFSLDKADGPGDFALYTYDGLAGADVLFDSADGVPDSFDIAQNTHAHGGWAFRKEGTYRLTFTMSGRLADGTKVSDTETLAFVVGDGADPSEVSGGDDSPDSATDSGSSETSAEAATGSTDASGSMAHTGADGTVLLGSVAAGLAVAGAGAVWAVRRRRTGEEA